MATIGQVVYNLQDFHSSGGLISTLAGDPSKTITSESSSYKDSRLNIFSNDLVEFFKAASFIKLGIQAPPGTKAVLNGNKTIMLGRTGVYELDEGIKITSLKFLRPYKYIINAGLTQQALEDGMNQLNSAKDFLQNEIARIDNKYPTKNQEYWAEYVSIQDEYLEQYNTALNLYKQGINGIYQLPVPDDPDNEENFSEVYNIIVDFLY